MALTRRERRLGLLFLGAWRLVGLLALPVLLLHPRARRHILSLPAPTPGWTWLHGASAGEHRAALGLLTALPGPVWRTSSSWRTPVPDAFPAPLDLPWVLSRWLDRARPARLILIEAELWPGWLAACRARRIPVAVVHARPSRSALRWQRHLPTLWRWLTHDLTIIPQAETGDLKRDAPPPPAPFTLPRHPALLAASTRPGEEALLLAAWALLPPALLVLAPRHLHRAEEIAALLRDSGRVWCRRTQRLPSADTEVLLLDTLGEVAGLMREADAAFIGGTFDPAIGGHSPAEATAVGLPVVRGPHHQANPQAWHTAATATFPVPDADPVRLAAALRAALAAPRGAPPDRPPTAAIATVARLPAPCLPPERLKRPLLAPLRPIWLAIGRRLPSYRSPPQRIDIPVISVGALAAGGAGKTPAVAWLAAHLTGAWVVARGYRRPARGPAIRFRPEEGLGDELEMLWRRGVPVVSAPDRLAGARAAQERGATLILLDDGFQHRRLARDLDIVCLDARWPRARGLLPAGDRREPWGALARADWLWLHNHEAGLSIPDLPDRPTVHARPVPVGWLRQGARLPLDALPPGPHPVVTGIARPEGFVCTLLDLGIRLTSVGVHPDHAPLRRVPPGALVTEKDAARLPPEADVWALQMALEVTAGAEPLLAAIRAMGPVRR